MANINTELEQIKKAVYGREVRGSIANAIELINKEQISTNTAQTNLDSKFNQLIINAGNSNAEVVAARVKADGTQFDTLGKRLDKGDEVHNILNNEVISARTDSKNVTHKNLKVRLDNFDSRLDTLGKRLDKGDEVHNTLNNEVISARTDSKNVTHKNLKARLDNFDSQLDENKKETARKAYVEYVDTQDADIIRQIGQGVTDAQLKNAVQSKINDGSIASLAVGKDSVRPLNLNNGAKSVDPLIWRISEDSVIKNNETITIDKNVGVVYRDKFIHITPNSYTFDSADSYLILRDVALQTNPSKTHTPILVKRININENDIILAYYSAQITSIWDSIIAEYLSPSRRKRLSVNRRTAIGSYGYISSRYPFNVDIINKQVTFNADTYICYNKNFVKIANTTVDITNALNGGHLYYDLIASDFTVTKPNHEEFIWLGTIWVKPLVIGLNSTNGFTVNGMTYNQTISRWNGEVLNVIGDSITYGVGCTTPYHQWLKQLCGFKTVNNYGVSGSTIARRQNDSISWDTAIALVDRLNLIDKTAKVTTVFMGVNDFITGRLLGTFDSTDVTNFYGALHYVCKYFRENMPDKIVTFITPMQFNWKLRPPVGGNTDGTNKNGNTLLDFVNAIKEICGFYGYTVLDMYHNSFYGLSDKTVEIFMPDKLHINDLGHKEIIAPRTASHINSH